MGNFNSGFWNIFIIVCTLGGLLAMFLLTFRSTSEKRDTEEVETMGHVWDEDLEELNNPLPKWWVNMFYITILFGALYLMFYPGLGSNDMFLGWTQVKQYEQEVATAQERYGPIFEQYQRRDLVTLANDEEALRIGRRLFANYCTTCHGSDAGGVPGFPNLRDDEWLYGGGPETIEKTILDGRNGVMPPWGQVLGEDGVQAMTDYVLTLSGREADPAGAAAGKEQFKTLCVACHGPDGRGNQQIGAPDLTNDAWLYGGTRAAIATSIAQGRMGHMPAHRDFLGEAKVHLLAAYVYSLRR